MPKKPSDLPIVEKNGIFYFRKRIGGGKRFTRSLQTSDWAEACKRAIELNDELERESATAELGEQKLFGIVAAEFIDTQAQYYRPNALKRYATSFTTLGRLITRRGIPFTHIPIHEISRADCQDILNRDAKDNTVRNDLTAVSAVLDYAIESEYVEHNVVRDIKRARYRKRRPTKNPTIGEHRGLDFDVRLVPEHELQAVIEACKTGPATMLHHLVEFYARFGLRQDEGVRLRWSFLDEANEVLAIHGSQGFTRYRQLSADDLAWLLQLPRHHASDVVFWHGARGEPFANVSSNLGYVRRKLQAQGKGEFRWRPHDLRHKFAIDYLTAGGDIFLLKDLLGHTKVSTTELYVAHMTPAQIRQRSEALKLRGVE